MQDFDLNGQTEPEFDDRGIIKTARRYFSKMGFRLVIGMVALYGICLGAQTIIFNVFPQLGDDYTGSLLGSAIPQYLLAMPALALIISIGMPKKVPEKRRVGFGWCVLFFFIAYAVMYAGNLAATMINMVISSFFGSSMSTYSAMEYVENADIGVVSLIVVLCAPIIEEIIFRKLIIDRCGAYGQAASALVSGLAFGLCHGNINQALYTFCLGYLFAIIYSKTGKIYITIGIHMVINFLGSFVAMKFLNMANLNALENIDINNTDALMAYVQTNGVGILLFAAYAFLLSAIVIAGTVLLIVNRRKFIPERNGINLPKNTTFKTVVFNPGMIVFIVIMVAYIAYNFVMGLEG